MDEVQHRDTKITAESKCMTYKDRQRGLCFIQSEVKEMGDVTITLST